MKRNWSQMVSREKKKRTSDERREGIKKGKTLVVVCSRSPTTAHTERVAQGGRVEWLAAGRAVGDGQGEGQGASTLRQVPGDATAVKHHCSWLVATNIFLPLHILLALFTHWFLNAYITMFKQPSVEQKYRATRNSQVWIILYIFVTIKCRQFVTVVNSQSATIGLAK